MAAMALLMVILMFGFGHMGMTRGHGAEQQGARSPSVEAMQTNRDGGADPSTGNSGE